MRPVPCPAAPRFTARRHRRWLALAQEEVNAIFEVLARKHVLDPDQLPLWEAGLQDERVLL